MNARFQLLVDRAKYHFEKGRILYERKETVLAYAQFDLAEQLFNAADKYLDWMGVPKAEPCYYSLSVNVLGLPKETENKLFINNVSYIGELVQMTKHSLAKLLNTTSEDSLYVLTITKALAEHNLKLGMKLPNWKRPDSFPA